MNWLNDYQLFLFDFDGLLVNTEKIHFLAYKQMCENRGFHLPWDFSEYCLFAHYDAARLREEIYAALPGLFALEPNWAVLYEEKKRFMLDLLKSGAVNLMPGARKLLSELEKREILRCVVTNSPKEQIEIIKKDNPILNTIPYWCTREMYKKPKPNPECYLSAIAQMGCSKEKVIGFEDTPRGLRALLGTAAKPIFVSPITYPEIAVFKQKGVTCFLSLQDVCF